MVYATRHRVRIFIWYTLVVLVDRVYNCSASPYEDGYLLCLQCKL